MRHKYLGPSVTQLLHLLLLVVVNSLTLFALFILSARAFWSLGGNTTTIEDWEIERHEILLRRARSRGGYVNGPYGTRTRLVKQEFPYDIGVWKNLVQGMGSNNVSLLVHSIRAVIPHVSIGLGMVLATCTVTFSAKWS